MQEGWAVVSHDMRREREARPQYICLEGRRRNSKVKFNVAKENHLILKLQLIYTDNIAISYMYIHH